MIRCSMFSYVLHGRYLLADASRRRRGSAGVQVSEQESMSAIRGSTERVKEDPRATPGLGGGPAASPPAVACTVNAGFPLGD